MGEAPPLVGVDDDMGLDEDDLADLERAMLAPVLADGTGASAVEGTRAEAHRARLLSKARRIVAVRNKQ